MEIKDLIQILSTLDGSVEIAVDNSWGEYAPDIIRSIVDSGSVVILSSKPNISPFTNKLKDTCSYGKLIYNKAYPVTENED